MDFQDEDLVMTQKKTMIPVRNLRLASHLQQVYKNMAILGLDAVPNTWKDAPKVWKCLFHYHSAAVYAIRLRTLSDKRGYLVNRDCVVGVCFSVYFLFCSS